MCARAGLLALVFASSAGLAAGALAETNWGQLSAAERAAFGRELRDALLAAPEIVGQALAEPDLASEAFSQQVDDDLALLRRLAPQILGETDIALFTAPDCADCDRAVDELHELSETYGTTFTLHDLSDPQAAALAKELGLTEAPFYVLPRMVLRGQMPPVVLRRYLDRD